jgi:Vitamin-D-receptor interacting Mediator subunit 4
VSIHQANYSKIISLRATSEDLDTQIRDTLGLLTTTRKELLSAASTTVSSKANPVDVAELLSYASRSSKFTRPATFREGEAQSHPETGDGGINTPREAGSQTQTNGTSTPVAGTNEIATDMQMTQSTAMDIDSATPATQQPIQATKQGSQTALPAHWIPLINPEAEMKFVPWPSEDTIRRGALASIDILINKGVDPATFDPKKSEELEAERKRIQEEEDIARENERQRREEETRIMMERRASGLGATTASRQENKPAAFSLDMLDDDDEEEDIAREAEGRRGEDENRMTMQGTASELGPTTAPRQENKPAAFSLDMLDDEDDD